MKYRIPLIIFIIALPCFAAFDGSDYSEAMRMAVKFFGGQRCGNTHNWMLFENTDPKTTDSCHTKDAWNGNSVTGGWHDCGDHIKVAVTMGYAAICLLSAYDIWPAAFEDDHDQNYKSGENEIPDVLDEAKIATDYFMKCLINDKTFVYYVGNDADHSVWVTSSYQSTLGPGSGGDPRPVATTENAGGPQAADYASALALMAMHYPDSTYARKCREAAVKFYTFAKKYPTNISIPNFYSTPNTEVSDEYALAGILLYKLTNDTTYKTDAVEAIKGVWESNSALAWDTKADIAYYYMVRDYPNANNGEAGGILRRLLRRNVSAAMKGANSYGIPWGFFKSNWGTNKLACGSALPAALYAKLVEDSVIRADSVTADSAYAFNRKIVDYMLGANEFNHPFIHGYKGDMTHKVHHRNAMGKNELNFDSYAKNNTPFLFKSGALLGGPSGQGRFQNIVEGGDAFKETESGCDYNGPFVAALANIVAKLDPKVGSTAGPRKGPAAGHTVKLRFVNGRLESTAAAGRISVCGINGAVVASVRPGDRIRLPSGAYIIRGAGMKAERLVITNK